MIEGLIKNYNCPACHSTTISESHVDVIGAAGNTVNIDMQCPKCHKHYMARMEVVGLNLSDSEKFSKSSIENLKLNLDSLKNAFQKVAESKETLEMLETENTIQDQEIIDLSKSLKNKKLSVDDLLSE